MSVHVSSWVFKNSPAEKAERLVLLVLADYANGDGTGAYPSVTTIQCDARLRGRSTVQGALRKLEAANAIEATGADREGGSTIYRVSMDMAEQKWSGIYAPWEDPRDKHRRRRAQGGGTESVPPAGGTEKSPAGAQKTAPGGTDSGPNPSVNPPTNPSEPPNPLASEGELDKWASVLEEAKGYFPDVTHHVWIAPIRLVEQRGDTLVVTHDKGAQWVHERFAEQLREIAKGQYGPAVEIEVLVPADPDAAADKDKADIAEARRMRRATRARDQIKAAR